MRDKLIKRFVIGTFVSLYLLVSVISTIHVIDFFELSNPYWLAVTLAIGFEIGAAASLASLVILKKMNRTIVWSLFIAITLMQMQGNMYYAFINLTDFSSWSELFNLIEEDLIYQKRILAFVSGAILPLIALGFIKSLVDYIKPEDEDDETLTSGVMDDNMLSESNDGFDTQPSEEYFEDIESWDNTLMDGLEELEDEEDEELDEDSFYELYIKNGGLEGRKNYKFGEYDGLFESYYENGQLELKENYKDGKRDGLSEEYHENGQLNSKRNYKDGVYDGLYESYNENGQLEIKVNFKDGEIIYSPGEIINN